MKYNRSEIMKRAWELKNQNIRLAGRKLTSYNKNAYKTFGQCLTQAWKEAKETIAKAVADAVKVEAAKVETKVGAYVIPNWKMYEVELFGVRSNIVKETEIESESKKAFKIRGEWIPKSICEYVWVAA